MTAHDDFDRQFSAWLQEAAPRREPEPLLDEVLARTARTDRRPAWRIPERWIPMSSLSTRAATTGSPVPWRAVGLVALLVLALVGGALVIAGGRQDALPAPFGPAANGLILTVEGGNVLVRDTVDGPARTLVDVDLPVVGPWPAPDGTRFSYLTVNPDDTLDLWVADIDGSNGRRVAGPYRGPDQMDWSADGAAIAVGEVPPDGDPYVEFVRADGTGVTRLDVGMPAERPMFRPSDRGQLLFRGTPAGGEPGLYLTEPGAPAEAPRRLDLAPRLDTGTPMTSYADAASWSPDGTRILFHRLDPAADQADGVAIRIHVVDVDAAGLVANERAFAFPSGSDADFDAQWLPTGDGMVFQRAAADGRSLMAAALDPSSAERSLGIADPDGIEFVSVQPDGSSVLAVVGPSRSIWSSSIADGLADDLGLTSEDLVVTQRIAP